MSQDLSQGERHNDDKHENHDRAASMSDSSIVHSPKIQSVIGVASYMQDETELGGALRLTDIHVNNSTHANVRDDRFNYLTAMRQVEKLQIIRDDLEKSLILKAAELEEERQLTYHLQVF